MILYEHKLIQIVLILLDAKCGNSLITYYCYAGVVQRLVRGLAKAETWVRFPSLAPFEINVELIDVFICFEVKSKLEFFSNY